MCFTIKKTIFLIYKKEISNPKSIIMNQNHECIEDTESITRDLCNKYIKEMLKKEIKFTI